jgi:hypothetical protein
MRQAVVSQPLLSRAIPGDSLPKTPPQTVRQATRIGVGAVVTATGSAPMKVLALAPMKVLVEEQALAPMKVLAEEQAPAPMNVLVEEQAPALNRKPVVLEPALQTAAVQGPAPADHPTQVASAALRSRQRRTAFQPLLQRYFHRQSSE